jgi:hypothetical protein
MPKAGNDFLSEGVNEVGQDVTSFDAPDIGPEEYAEHMANVLANALQATKIFGVVEVQAGIGQVNVMGRVKRDSERVFLDKVVTPILVMMNKIDDVEGFIGKQFLLRDGGVKYAWVISYASNDLKKATFAVCQAFEGAIPRLEVTESPLMGPPTPQSGGTTTGRKGASPVR